MPGGLGFACLHTIACNDFLRRHGQGCGPGKHAGRRFKRQDLHGRGLNGLQSARTSAINPGYVPGNIHAGAATKTAPPAAPSHDWNGCLLIPSTAGDCRGCFPGLHQAGSGACRCHNVGGHMDQQALGFPARPVCRRPNPGAWQHQLMESPTCDSNPNWNPCQPWQYGPRHEFG